MLKAGQNTHLPFPLNEIDCELSRASFSSLYFRATSDSLLPFPSATGIVRWAFVSSSWQMRTLVCRITKSLLWRTPNHVSPPINPEGSFRVLGHSRNSAPYLLKALSF